MSIIIYKAFFKELLSAGCTHTLLMPLPEDTSLMANGIQVPSTKNYMIDHNGNVYAYIEAQDAAVESEIMIAYTADGQEIKFCFTNAEKTKVISYDAIIQV